MPAALTGSDSDTCRPRLMQAEAQPPSNGKQQLPSAEQTAALIKARRSIAIKDFNDEPVARQAFLPF